MIALDAHSRSVMPRYSNIRIKYVLFCWRLKIVKVSIIVLTSSAYRFWNLACVLQWVRDERCPYLALVICFYLRATKMWANDKSFCSTASLGVSPLLEKPKSPLYLHCLLFCIECSSLWRLTEIWVVWNVIGVDFICSICWSSSGKSSQVERTVHWLKSSPNVFPRAHLNESPPLLPS